MSLRMSKRKMAPIVAAMMAATMPRFPYSLTSGNRATANL
jgi:hypothetical protein